MLLSLAMNVLSGRNSSSSILCRHAISRATIEAVSDSGIASGPTSTTVLPRCCKAAISRSRLSIRNFDPLPSGTSPVGVYLGGSQLIAIMTTWMPGNPSIAFRFLAARAMHSDERLRSGIGRQLFNGTRMPLSLLTRKISETSGAYICACELPRRATVASAALWLGKSMGQACNPPKEKYSLRLQRYWLPTAELMRATSGLNREGNPLYARVVTDETATTRHPHATQVSTVLIGIERSRKGRST